LRMIAVIGDIHGCYFTFVELYRKIKNSYPEIPIYLVGDLVDRGLNSYKVMSFVESEKIKFTPGNHDYMFLHFFKDPASIFARSWVFNGNEPTLISYEDNNNELFRHIELIAKMPVYYNLDDCFISHAGISNYYAREVEKIPEGKDPLEVLLPIIEAEKLSENGILWNRDELLNIGKLQVVGHTHQKEVTYIEESNAVYIDTAACIGNKLSAVIIHRNEIVDTLDEETHLEDIIY